MAQGAGSEHVAADGDTSHGFNSWRPCVEAWFPSIYDCLRDLAERRFRGESAEHTLQPTALVHEAYLRLAEADPRGWRDQTHFFAVAARAIRYILVDHARRKASVKRGGRHLRVPLDGTEVSMPGTTTDILALHEALGEFAKNHGRAASVVELRFFSGLSVAETADALEVSASTVKDDWQFACAWLNQRLGEST